MINIRFGLNIFSIFVILFLFTPETPCGGMSYEEKDAAFVTKDGIIKLNNIIVNKVEREIRMKVRLALDKGILEFFLVGDHGKTYESTFKISDNAPSELNFALLLIGSNPLPLDRVMQLADQHDGPDILRSRHRDSLVSIDILKNGKGVHLQQIVADREKKNRPQVWVHTGGIFIPGNRYAADLESGYIGIWPNERMVINLFPGHKNPYQGDFGFEMQSGLKVDDEYELVIRRVP
jgi:hypothetical protein